MRDDNKLEEQIASLLSQPEYEGHPLREPLAALFQRYQDNLNQIEKLTSISDGYQSAIRERNHSLADRYRKQLRQLQKIVRISDHYQEMLRELNQALKTASTQDPLTGLSNRRLMLERLNAEVASVERQRPSFSLVAVDIDHFKAVNDQHGHDIGDVALVAIAKVLTETLRAYDVCARWGGEEFMILLPETPGSIAQAISERLREKVETLHHPDLPATLKTSVSIGVAEHIPQSDLAETTKRADSALYAAKRAGRNCVVLAD